MEKFVGSDHFVDDYDRGLLGRCRFLFVILRIVLAPSFGARRFIVRNERSLYCDALLEWTMRTARVAPPVEQGLCQERAAITCLERIGLLSRALDNIRSTP